jgi:hypothetical protein
MGSTMLTVQLCMDGDLKLPNGWMGLCGCVSKYTCIYCKARKKHLLRTNSAWGGFGELPMRTVLEMTQFAAHVVLDYDYVCPAPGAVLWHWIANCMLWVINVCVCVCVCACICDLLIEYDVWQHVLAPSLRPIIRHLRKACASPNANNCNNNTSAKAKAANPPYPWPCPCPPHGRETRYCLT